MSNSTSLHDAYSAEHFFDKWVFKNKIIAILVGRDGSTYDINIEIYNIQMANEMDRKFKNAIEVDKKEQSKKF